MWAAVNPFVYIRIHNQRRAGSVDKNGDCSMLIEDAILKDEE
jgi:hypothetical protein